MTDYTDLGPLPAVDIEPGDRVTFTLKSLPKAVTTTDAYLDFIEVESGSVAATLLLGTPVGMPGMTIIKVERPLPELPTRDHALLVPTGAHTTGYYHYNGIWRDGFGRREDEVNLREYLAQGWLALAYEGK